MNLAARIKPFTRLFSSFPPKQLFYPHSIQRCNSYSATAHKTPKLINPRILKSPAVSRGIKKQADAPATVWPKPAEIPYQAKVANSVNLIGNVKIPVHFDCDSDGKHFTTIVISLGNKSSLLIPVVFEGDLAHVVACHVKEGNYVFVTGQLSAEPLRFVPIENLGKFHVVADNLNFVEVFEKEETSKLDKSLNSSKPLPEAANLELGKKNDAADQIGDLWRDLVKNPLQWYDYRQLKTNRLVKETHPDFKQKESGEALWLRSAPKWVLPGLGTLECDVKDLKPKQVEGKVEECWKSLVENPSKWWDNRATKKNPKAPDFKHKDTGQALWLDSSPAWALSKLPPLEPKEDAW